MLGFVEIQKSQIERTKCLMTYNDIIFRVMNNEVGELGDSLPKIEFCEPNVRLEAKQQAAA